MRLFIAIAFSLLGLYNCQSGEPVAAPEKEQKIEVFCQIKDRGQEVSFYMWVNGADATVVNSAPNVSYGYDFFGSGLYLESKDIGNAMFFVHPYDKDKSDQYRVKVVFGGSRDNDIHIYPPKGYKVSTSVSKIKEDKK